MLGSQPTVLADFGCEPAHSLLGDNVAEGITVGVMF